MDVRPSALSEMRLTKSWYQGPALVHSQLNLSRIWSQKPQQRPLLGST